MDVSTADSVFGVVTGEVHQISSCASGVGAHYIVISNQYTTRLCQASSHVALQVHRSSRLTEVVSHFAPLLNHAMGLYQPDLFIKTSTVRIHDPSYPILIFLSRGLVYR